MIYIDECEFDYERDLGFDDVFEYRDERIYALQSFLMFDSDLFFRLTGLQGLEALQTIARWTVKELCEFASHAMGWRFDNADNNQVRADLWNISDFPGDMDSELYVELSDHLASFIWHSNADVQETIKDYSYPGFDPSKFMRLTTINIVDKFFHGNCVEVMKQIPAGTVNLIFADPPFNIGLSYDKYDDRLTAEQYRRWSQEWIAEAYLVCANNGSIYCCIGDEYAADLNIALKRAGFIFRNWIVWHYGFGENQKRKFSRCKTHILYFTKSENFVFNQADILVPSARQLVYKDKRAKGGGKTPDDVWPVYADAGGLPHELAVYPQDWEMWCDSRVCGTFRERLIKPDGSAHPCQMPLSILRRIVRASTRLGDLVLDPFSGTGTTAAAAAELGCHFVGIDLSAEYCALGAERVLGDPAQFETFNNQHLVA